MSSPIAPRPPSTYAPGAYPTCAPSKNASILSSPSIAAQSSKSTAASIARPWSENTVPRFSRAPNHSQNKWDSLSVKPPPAAALTAISPLRSAFPRSTGSGPSVTAPIPPTNTSSSRPCPSAPLSSPRCWPPANPHSAQGLCHPGGSRRGSPEDRNVQPSCTGSRTHPRFSRAPGLQGPGFLLRVVLLQILRRRPHQVPIVIAQHFFERLLGRSASRDPLEDSLKVSDSLRFDEVLHICQRPGIC